MAGSTPSATTSGTTSGTPDATTSQAAGTETTREASSGRRAATDVIDAAPAPPMDGPDTVLPPSRMATAAVWLAGATALAAVLAGAGRVIGVVPQMPAVAVLQICLGATFLTATLAALGWMHARERIDGRFDRRGARRAVVAGVVAGTVLVAVTLSLGGISGHHDVQTEIVEEEGANAGRI